MQNKPVYICAWHLSPSFFYFFLDSEIEITFLVFPVIALPNYMEDFGKSYLSQFIATDLSTYAL